MCRSTRLPVVPSGVQSANCFIAGVLAHTGQLDLSTQSVSQRAIRRIRDLPNVPGHMHEWLDGRAQQAVADHMDVGYVLVNPRQCIAMVFTANRRQHENLPYAVLAWTQPNHVDPVATHGGRRCGLLHYEAMRRLLARRQIAVLFAREGELLYIESD